MAERLKTSLLEEDSVDFICGPDAYRDIPLLVNIATSTGSLEDITVSLTTLFRSKGSQCSTFIGRNIR